MITIKQRISDKISKFKLYNHAATSNNMATSKMEIHDAICTINLKSHAKAWHGIVVGCIWFVCVI